MNNIDKTYMKRFITLLVVAVLMTAACGKTKEPEIKNIGQPEVAIAPEGGSASVTFSTNCAWDASIDGNWATISPISGPESTNAKITVTAGRNDGPDVRSATITIIAEGAILKVKVTQAVAEPETVDVSSVAIDPTQATLTEGETLQLTATVQPDNATDKTVAWSSSDAAVATVTDGLVTAVGEGQATITAKSGSQTVTCTVTVEPVGPKMVDLGLSVKWAECNLGAQTPEEYGDYYAWAETEVKPGYDLQNAKWFYLSSETVTKYVTHSNNGTVDNNTHIDPEDDAAHVLYGDKWRIPTDEEWAELGAECTWEWIGDESNQGGYKVTASNGNFIYLPASGFWQGNNAGTFGYNGFYWTANVLTSHCPAAMQMQFNPGGRKMEYFMRFFGCPIRPVYGDVVMVGGISINKDKVDMVPGELLQLTAVLSPGNAFEKGILWSSSDASVATVNTNFEEGGLVTAMAAGETIITATSVDGGYSASCTVTVESADPKMVDLGLSVKWADRNLGAHTPYEHGSYYSWGETAPKNNYNLSSYKFGVGPYSKYNGSDKTVLDPEDDAAYVTLGGTWRMPTVGEIDELVSTRNNAGYMWEWKSLNGVNGWLVTYLVNNNSIFFPASGYCDDMTLRQLGSYGEYWSSSLCLDEASYVYNLGFESYSVARGDSSRHFGYSIRAVSE